MLYTHNVSVSKHLTEEKKDTWMCPPTWKLDLTRPLKKLTIHHQPNSLTR